RRMKVASSRGVDAPSSRSVELEEDSTRAAGDDAFVTSAFAQMGSQQPGSESDILDANTRAVEASKPRARSRQYVATRGAGMVVADVVPQAGEAAAQIEVMRQGDGESKPLARLRVRVRDRLGTVEFLEVDHSGRMFVFGENIP